MQRENTMLTLDAPLRLVLIDSDDTSDNTMVNPQTTFTVYYVDDYPIYYDDSN